MTVSTGFSTNKVVPLIQTKTDSFIVWTVMFQWLLLNYSLKTNIHTWQSRLDNSYPLCPLVVKMMNQKTKKTLLVENAIISKPEVWFDAMSPSYMYNHAWLRQQLIIPRKLHLGRVTDWLYMYLTYLPNPSSINQKTGCSRLIVYSGTIYRERPCKITPNNSIWKINSITSTSRVVLTVYPRGSWNKMYYF